MVLLRYYKNSIPALFLSIFGSALQCLGVIGIFGNFAMGLSFLVEGSLLFFWGKRCSQHKTFRQWQKANANVDLEGIIRSSTANAYAVYDKCPNIYTQRYIKKFNPEAADIIAADNKLTIHGVIEDAKATAAGGAVEILKGLVQLLLEAFIMK